MVTKEYQRQWRVANVDRVNGQARVRAAAGRRRVSELKNQPCLDCGGSFPPECMDFDHRPGEVKVSAVSALYTCSMSHIEAEIAKCDLVCANCHRTRTKKRRNLKRVTST